MKPGRTAILVAAAIGFSAGAPRVFAETRSIEVDVQSMIQPSTAVGLLISADGTIERPSTKIEKKSADSIVVTFEVPASQVRPDSVASALVVSEKGEVVFGNVKPLLTADTDQALGSVPLCPGEQIAVASLVGQYSVLEKIYSIRVKRRDQARANLEQTLSGDLLARLQKLERGFGLAREKELAPTLSAQELIDRLSRLRDAIQNWKQRNEPTPTPVQSAPQVILDQSEQLDGSITAPSVP